MGRSRVWTYRIEIKCVSGHVYTPQEWRVRGKFGAYGTPSPVNIDKWVTHFEDAMKPGGVNAHLGTDQVTRAMVVDQRTNEVVAVWTRKLFRPDQPMFEVIA